MLLLLGPGERERERERGREREEGRERERERESQRERERYPSCLSSPSTDLIRHHYSNGVYWCYVYDSVEIIHWQTQVLYGALDAAFTEWLDLRGREKNIIMMEL